MTRLSDIVEVKMPASCGRTFRMMLDQDRQSAKARGNPLSAKRRSKFEAVAFISSDVGGLLCAEVTCGYRPQL